MRRCPRNPAAYVHERGELVVLADGAMQPHELSLGEHLWLRVALDVGARVEHRQPKRKDREEEHIAHGLEHTVCLHLPRRHG